MLQAASIYITSICMFLRKFFRPRIMQKTNFLIFSKNLSKKVKRFCKFEKKKRGMVNKVSTNSLISQYSWNWSRLKRSLNTKLFVSLFAYHCYVSSLSLFLRKIRIPTAPLVIKMREKFMQKV